MSVGAGGGPMFDRLKEWRRERASADGVPAYVVFHDKTLAEIAERKPRDWADLAAISGRRARQARSLRRRDPRAWSRRE